MKNKAGVSSADKLLSVLELFTLEKPEWTIEAASAALSISLSTGYRYFTSLTRSGFLDPHSSGRYSLGPAIIILDRQLRKSDPLISIAGPVMERLVRRNDGSGVALLCRRFHQHVICVHQYHEGAMEHASSYERGRLMGLYRGAASLIVLAHLPPRLLKSKWQTDANAIQKAGLGDSWEEFRNNLKGVRNSGVCVTHGQLDKGMVGISAPIFLPGGQITGSMSMVVTDTIDAAELNGLKTLVLAAAQEMTAPKA